MTTTEKVAYLKGLMEGMAIDKESNEGKLFNVIADILNDMSLDIEDIENDVCDLSEDVDAISDDLSDVEDYIFDEDEDDDDDDCDCCCCNGEPLFMDVTCPACNKTITIDEDVLNLGTIQCPNCGEMIEFDVDEDEEEDED